MTCGLCAGCVELGYWIPGEGSGGTLRTNLFTPSSSGQLNGQTTMRGPEGSGDHISFGQLVYETLRLFVHSLPLIWSSFSETERNLRSSG